MGESCGVSSQDTRTEQAPLGTDRCCWREFQTQKPVWEAGGGYGKGAGGSSSTMILDKLNRIRRLLFAAIVCWAG